MDPERTFVPVPVPEDLVEDVYAFIAERRRGSQPEPDPDATWDEDRLRRLAGHHNEELQKLLRYVAEASPEWVRAEDAMAAAGRGMGKSAGGFFSRMNRSARSRYGLGLPIRRDYRPDLQYKWDGPDGTAELFLRVRGEG